MSRLREGRRGQGGSASARGAGRAHPQPPEGPCAAASAAATAALGQRGAQRGRVGWNTAWSCRQSIQEVDLGVGWLVLFNSGFPVESLEGGFLSEAAGPGWNPKELWPSPSSEVSKRGRRGHRAVRCSLESASAFGASSAFKRD